MNRHNKKSRKSGFLNRVVDALRKHFRKGPALGTDRYLPEKHYMRGPGPKTRAKQQHLDMRAEPLSQ